MDEDTVCTNSYGGFLSIDDDVCLYQSLHGDEVPDDITPNDEDYDL